MRAQLAIIIEFGFHEIKKFIHSGLAEKLKMHFDIHFMVIEKERKFIKSEFSKYGEIHFISGKALNLSYTFSEMLARASAEAWMRNHKIPLFHNTRTLPKRKKWDFILGSSLMKKQLVKKGIRNVVKEYQNEEIANLLKSNAITHVLGVSTTSSFSKTIFVTSQEMGLTTYYLVNSWKDIYVNPWIPIVGFDEIFVWDQRMKADYLRICSYLSVDKIHVTGNPSFDPYIGYSPEKSKDYYCRKYGLDARKKWLYYTMMPPGIWPGEIQHVLELGKQFYNLGLPVEILIRKNPNHHSSDFTELSLPSNCTLTEHHITFDPIKDLIIQTPQGEQEWMDLVYYTDVNISIPSTVTLEFLALSKPIINPKFSMSGEFPEGLLQHFESGFYKPLFDQFNVIRVESFEALVCHVSMPNKRHKGQQPEIFRASDKITQRMAQ